MMKHIPWSVVAVGWLSVAGGATSGQSGARIDPAIIGDVSSPKPGAALSARALITNPTPIKGVMSWTIETRRIRHRFSATALSPDGKLVATGGIDGIIRLWDVASGRLVRALVGHDSYIYGLAFSPGGKYLASGGAFDGTARIWDAATGQPLRILTGHPGYVVQVGWSGDGKKLIAAGGVSGDISIWNIATGLISAKASLGQHIVSLAVDPTAERCAAVTNELRLTIVDTKTGKAQRSLGEPADKVSCVAWSPDGKVLAAGAAKATFLFDPNTGKTGRTLDVSSAYLDWSRDGSRLAAICSDGTTRLWNAADGAMQLKIAAGGTALYLLPGNANVLLGDSAALTTLAWADGKRIAHHDLSGMEPPYWHPGRPIVTGILTAPPALWEPATGRLRCKLDEHAATVAAFAFSPDGKAIATAGHDKTVRVFKSADGSLTHTLAKHTAAVLAVAWSPDGKEIVSGGADKKTIVWDAKTGEPMHTRTEHAAAIQCLAFSPAGSVLAAGGDDGKIFTYTRPGWKPGKPLTTPNQTSVLSLAWTTDGKTLAAGDINGTALLWSPAKAKLISALPTVGSPPHINSMVFYAKGEMLATARGNHTLVLWSTATGKSSHSLPTMAPALHAVNAPPYLAVAAQDRTCRFFEPISGKLRGLILAEPEQIVALSMDGHYRADGAALDGLVYVVQTPRGQDTLTPAEFTARYKWKNDPAQARFAGK
jgi:WD40 repeat protein